MKNQNPTQQHCLQQSRLLCLRALAADDIPIWAAWFNDLHVTAYMNKGGFPNTESVQGEIFERLHQSRQDVQMGVTLTRAKELVGVIGLHRIDWVHRRGEISVVIGDPDAQGKGVATEAISLMVNHAFGKLNLHKVTAGMWATNGASRRAFEKNGFLLEGTFRDSYWLQTGYVDEIRLGLVRTEWERTRDASR